MGEGGDESKGCREGVIEWDKLPVNWCGSLRAVPGLTRQQTELRPVHVLLGETENAGSKKKTGELRENQEVDRFEIAK